MDYEKLLHVKIETTPDEIISAGASAITEVLTENPLSAIFSDEISKIIAMTAHILLDQRFKDGGK